MRIGNAVMVRAVAAAFVGALALTGLSGCSAAEVGKHCDFNVANPHESAGMLKKGHPGYVDAKAGVTCSVALTSLTATIKMQKKVSGKWKDVAGTSHTEHWTNTRAKKKYTVMTGEMHQCKGEFRAAASGNGVYQGKTSGSLAWQYGKAVTNPC